MNYLAAFALSALLSLALTPLVRRWAIKRGIVDLPGPRKIHVKPIARPGGLAIFLAFTMTLLLFVPLNRHLAGLLAGAVILLIVGIIDDIKGLGPWHKLVWQIVAAGVALAGGIGIIHITNPLGGVINLDWARFAVHLGSWQFHITPIANLFSIIWIVGVINTINFLDGLDGLAGGVSAISAIIMFLLAISPSVHQPETAMIAIVLAGAVVGFLPSNFFPAKIFMGDSGAYFLGLILALLAIYSGGKLATAALVLGFTIIDGIWTVLRRLYARQPIFKADRRHLHHLLLDVGISHRAAVLLLYVLSLCFGVAALFIGSFAKLVALIVLAIVMVSLIGTLLYLAVRRTQQKS